MSERTLIIHGWSDCSDSFKNIKEFLGRNGFDAESIYYADYESKEDNITYNDVVDGLNDQLINKGFIDKAGRPIDDINVIVHSTGGLVIRHWIWRYYLRDGNRIDQCPVKRVIMLAPANFGAPLAHRGKSVTGSLVKGRWKIGDLFEVGRQLLEGLELGSPYQWWLANNDLIINRPYFNSGQIQLTILVGIEDYKGWYSWVNKPGTDGTVAIAGTSIDSAKLTLDFCNPDKQYEWKYSNPPDDFAFGVLAGLNHGSIVDSIHPQGKTEVGELILKALKVENTNDFNSFKELLEKKTDATYNNHKDKSKFQQFIVHAVDDHDVSIRDFTLEFYILMASRKVGGNTVAEDNLTEKEEEYSTIINDEITREFHTHSIDSSYRGFLVDTEKIKTILHDAQQEIGGNIVLSVRIFVPEIDRGIKFDTSKLQNVILLDPNSQKSDLPSFFYENTTTLIELKVNRVVGPEYVYVDKAPKKR